MVRRRYIDEKMSQSSTEIRLYIDGNTSQSSMESRRYSDALCSLKNIYIWSSDNTSSITVVLLQI